MANIHINRGGTSLGIFPSAEVEEGLRSGRFLGTDLGWQEGMAAWQPLSQFAEFAVAGATVTPDTPPTAAALPVVLTAVRSGLPWARRQELGIATAFFETLKMVLLQPALAFSLMKREGGIGEPIIYALIGGSVGFLFYFLFTIFFQSIGFMASSRNPLIGLFGAGAGIIAGVIAIPFFLLFGIFVGSALLHLCLMLVGGAKRSFETTLRVVCFTVGSTYPIMIVPMCGGLVAGVWAIVVECIGIARAHEIETGRAVLAVFLPIVICCGGGLLLGIMFGTLGALFGHH